MLRVVKRWLFLNSMKSCASFVKHQLIKATFVTFLTNSDSNEHLKTDTIRVQIQEGVICRTRSFTLSSNNGQVSAIVCSMVGLLSL